MSTRLVPGTLLADTYKVIRLIGVGGMGEVYEASHERLPGRYAVKVLLGDIVGRTEIFQRFQREAQVTSGLRHPNIVQVLDFNVTYHPTEFHVDGSRASRSLVLAMKPLAAGATANEAAGDGAVPATYEDAASRKGKPHAKRRRKQPDILTAR